MRTLVVFADPDREVSVEAESSPFLVEQKLEHWSRHAGVKRVGDSWLAAMDFLESAVFTRLSDWRVMTRPEAPHAKPDRVIRVHCRAGQAFEIELANGKN